MYAHAAVLEALAAMPIYFWSGIGDDTRHLGPMAQDFQDAFAVGRDDKHISTVDLDGVALAATQGLYKIVQGQETEMAALHHIDKEGFWRS